MQLFDFNLRVYRSDLPQLMTEEPPMGLFGLKLRGQLATLASLLVQYVTKTAILAQQLSDKWFMQRSMFIDNSASPALHSVAESFLDWFTSEEVLVHGNHTVPIIKKVNLKGPFTLHRYSTCDCTQPSNPPHLSHSSCQHPNVVTGIC